MKKKFLPVFCLLLALFVLPLHGLAAQAPASAEGVVAKRWAKGSISAGETIDIYAPLGGQLLPYSIKVGDKVEENQALVTLDPLEINAPFDGVIRSLQAGVGDQAANVIGQYQGLCYLDRSPNIQWIHATTQGGYNDPDNRNIVIGETLKIQDGSYNSPTKTEGRVVSFTDSGFIVEIPANTYDLEEDVRLYRTGDTEYKQRDQVGKGKVANPPFIPIVGEGVIACVLVENEQTVKQGDSLFIVDNPSANHKTCPIQVVEAPAQGYISAIAVQPGQQVAQNQLLFSIKATNLLEAVIQVDEMDIGNLSVNGVVEVVLDAFADERYSCLIKEISHYGIEQLDTTKYEVTLTLPDQLLQKVNLGMHLTGYWEGK